jgi:hypothetical protein
VVVWCFPASPQTATILPVEDRLSRIMSCILYPSRIPDVFSHVGSKIGLWIQSDKYARILFFLDINSISVIIGVSPM